MMQYVNQTFVMNFMRNGYLLIQMVIVLNLIFHFLLIKIHKILITFRAAPLKDRKIKFRCKTNKKLLKQRINNYLKADHESECIYFHIDLFNLGYTKKLINPDARVTYNYNDYLKRKYYYPFYNDIISYFKSHHQSFKIKRNKYMSNYKDKEIKFNSMVENWYNENKKYYIGIYDSEEMAAKKYDLLSINKKWTESYYKF